MGTDLAAEIEHAMRVDGLLEAHSIRVWETDFNPPRVSIDGVEVGPNYLYELCAQHCVSVAEVLKQLRRVEECSQTLKI